MEKEIKGTDFRKKLQYVMILRFDEYLNEHIENSIVEEFDSADGIHILMKELIKPSGEKIKYEVKKREEWVAQITNYEVVRAGGSVVVFDFLSIEKAEQFIKFMIAECWTSDMYMPQYSEKSYFEIKNSSWAKEMNSRTLCQILEKFNVDLKKLIHENRGKLHGNKYGL